MQRIRTDDCSCFLVEKKEENVAEADHEGKDRVEGDVNAGEGETEGSVDEGDEGDEGEDDGQEGGKTENAKELAKVRICPFKSIKVLKRKMHLFRVVRYPWDGDFVRIVTCFI